MFEFAIDSLEFNSGIKTEIEKSALTIFIGPNSAGKSTILREIQLILQRDARPRDVVKYCNTYRNGDEEEFIKWLKNHYPSRDNNGSTLFLTKNSHISEAQIIKKFDRDNLYMPFLCLRLDTASRLSIAGTKESHSFDQNPNDFIHILQGNSDLHEEVSNEILQSFGKQLLINWGGGRNVWFHAGNEPDRDSIDDRVSSKYLTELNKIPKLDEDGDGIKSFVGCILAVKCGSHPILLIDEPEAFLHPAQATRLGRTLAESAKQLKRQIIIATHSSEIIQGALSSKAKVSVCRVSREKNITNVSSIKSRQLKALWSKPLLQSSGAIDGIFHKGVIICESDSDCRFYEQILKVNEKNSTPKDLYFIHGGGKGEVATLAKSYRALNIKISAIVDFDILRNKNEFKKLFEIFGGSFSSIQSEYKSSSSSLSDLSRLMDASSFVNEVNKILQLISINKEISNENKKQISTYLSDSSQWSTAKKFGILKLKGGAAKDCKHILEECKKVGLFIIPNGELESWWREGPAKKSEWITEALNEIQNNQETFEEANKFLTEIFNFLDI